MFRRRMDAKLRMLARVPFFPAASATEGARLAQVTDIITAEAGEVLVRQGRAGHEFFVVLEGSAEVRRNDQHVTFLGVGDCFGELALLAGTPRSASVIARTRMSLVVIDDRAFLALLAESPTFSRALFTYMAERLRAADETALAG